MENNLRLTLKREFFLGVNKALNKDLDRLMHNLHSSLDREYAREIREILNGLDDVRDRLSLAEIMLRITHTS